jgi:hypothetical protein
MDDDPEIKSKILHTLLIFPHNIYKGTYTNDWQ